MRVLIQLEYNLGMELSGQTVSGPSRHEIMLSRTTGRFGPGHIHTARLAV